MSFLHSSSVGPGLLPSPPPASVSDPWPEVGPDGRADPTDRQLLPAQGPHGARKRPSVCMAGPQFCQAGSGWERRCVESRREMRLSLGGGWGASCFPADPNPVALHAQPPPGSPLLDLSQPVLLGHHLPPLSLHVAREGPQDVALLVSTGLWGQDRNLSRGCLTSHPLILPSPLSLLHLGDPASHCHFQASTSLAVKWGRNGTHLVGL